GLNNAQLIRLGGTRSANSLTFSSTGTTALQGGGTSSTLNLGEGGITINAGAGAVTIGATTSGNGTALRFATDQNWTNNSSNPFTVTNSIQSTATSGIQTLTVGGSGDSVFISAIGEGADGQVALTKSGSGTLTVNNSNTYDGVTSILGGIMEVANVANGGSSSSIGAAGADSANLVINGGTLKWTGTSADATNRGFTIGAAGATIDNTNTEALLRFGGVVTGSGNLTKTGTGLLALSGASDYAGKTIISGGIVSARTEQALGTSTGTADGTEVADGAALHLDPGSSGGSGQGSTWVEALSLSGGTLGNISENNRWEGTVALTGINTFAVASGTALTVVGVVSGNGGITKTEEGTLYLAASNSHTGVTTINAGTLRVGSLTNGGDSSGLGAAGSDAANLVLNGGTLWSSITSDNGVNRGFTLGVNGGTIRKDGGILRMGGVVTGSGELRKTGNGTFALSGADNDYTGRTVVTAGIMEARRAESLGAYGSAANGTLVESGGTLKLDPGGTGGSLVDTTWNETAVLNGGRLENGRRNNTWAGGVILQANSAIAADTVGSLTISSVISEEGGSFGFSKEGDGNVISTGLNTFTGTTSVTGGVLEARTTGGFDASTGLSVSTGTFRLGASEVFNDAATVTFGAGGILQTDGFSEILGVVAVNGGGTLDLSGNGGVVRFGDSSGETWSDLLTISGWEGLVTGGGAEQVIFGTDGNALTTDQLSSIRFADPSGFAPGLYDAAILGNGEIVPGSLIPEPSAVLLVAAGSVAAGFRRRRI
ncbi:MAG: PEP-CTERM sorting domain-containing protein, partial [Verrucomicrobiaceae bacterium]